MTPAERAARDGQSGLVVWFTGLSGAGKTTLARSVERQLWNRGGRTFLLDGDTLRANLCSDLGFSADDRRENIRRAGIVARLMAEAGLICLTALISPFRVDRLRARNEMPAGSFVEVFVNAPLEVCEQRDLKGLYQRARSGDTHTRALRERSVNRRGKHRSGAQGAGATKRAAFEFPR